MGKERGTAGRSDPLDRWRKWLRHQHEVIVVIRPTLHTIALLTLCCTACAAVSTPTSAPQRAATRIPSPTAGASPTTAPPNATATATAPTRSWPGAGPVERVASETLVARVDPAAPPIDDQYWVSPDGRRVGYFVEAGDGWAAVIDGQQGKGYEWTIIDDQRSTSRLVWSPDGSRVAYIGRADGKEFAVVDGQEGKPYDGVSSLTFSSDSRQVAYVATDGQAMIPVAYGWDHVNYVPNLDRKRFAVIDGQESPTYRGDGEGFVFSPDLSRLAYAASREGWHGLVLEGQPHGYRVFLSDDPLSGAGHDRVVGRQEGKGYTYVKRLFFSPDGRRLAYIAMDYSLPESLLIGVDGQEYGPYSGYCCPAFSPDGRHLAWSAMKGVGKETSGWFMVVDGREFRRYGTSWDFAFSPDGQCLAYEACEGEQCFVVVDGEAGRRYEDVIHHTLAFSPDSRWLAYAARQGGREFVVVDGWEGQPYDHILPYSLGFSPDSRWLAYVAEAGGRQFVVVGESEGQPCDEILGGRVVFDSPIAFHYLGRRGSEIYLVQETIEDANTAQGLDV